MAEEYLQSLQQPMIIQCPSCSTRFNVPDDKVTRAEIKVRCSKCSNVFAAGEGGGSFAGIAPPSSPPGQGAPAGATGPTGLGASSPFAPSVASAPSAFSDPFGASPPSPPGLGNPFNASSSTPSLSAATPPGFGPAQGAGAADFRPANEPKIGSADHHRRGEQILSTPGQTAQTAPWGAPAAQDAPGVAPPTMPSASSPSLAAPSAPAPSPSSTSMAALRKIASGPLPRVQPPSQKPPSQQPPSQQPPSQQPPPVAAPSSGPFSLPSDSRPEKPSVAHPRFETALAGAPDTTRPLGSPFAAEAPSLPPQPASLPGPAAAAIPPGADPFAAPAPPGAPDPFAQPTGSNPFAAAAAPFAPPAGQDTGQQRLANELFGDASAASGQPPPTPLDDGPGFEIHSAQGAEAGDPFSDLSQPADDPFAAAADVPGAAESPSALHDADGSATELDDPFAEALGAGADPLLTAEAAETRVHEVSDRLREQAKPAKRPKKRRLPLTHQLWFINLVRGLGKALSVVTHVVLATGFLLGAVLWARGGSLADIENGRLLSVVLFGTSGGMASEGDLDAASIVVIRRPLRADPQLVVITGRVENHGVIPISAVRVSVRFSEHGRVFEAWAGQKIDALDLALAPDRASLRALGKRVARADLLPGESVPFVVLATDIPDGAKARVRVLPAELPRAGARPDGAGG